MSGGSCDTTTAVSHGKEHSCRGKEGIVARPTVLEWARLWVVCTVQALLARSQNTTQHHQTHQHTQQSCDLIQFTLINA